MPMPILGSSNAHSWTRLEAYLASLRPGDVIGSGTCGTGCILELALVHGTDQYPWLRVGDEVSLTVDRLGTITNRVTR